MSAMTILLVVGASAILIVGCDARSADNTALSFKRIADDPRSYPDHITVVNGKEVSPLNWPSLLRAGFENPDGNLANCTATIVGPQVVLTAAHCADAGGTRSTVRPAFIDVAGVFVPMNCTMHPKYAAAPIPNDKDVPRSSEDYSLCLIGADLSTTGEFMMAEYEDIDMDTRLVPNSHILVIGDGCTKISVQGGRVVTNALDFVLRAGDGLVESATANLGPDADYVKSLSNVDNQPALCPGDSGGPLITGATFLKQTVSRRVAAVNSTITLFGPSQSELESRFAALATDDFRSFAKKWLTDHGNPIMCGVNTMPGQWPCRT
jgi:hypothetical protein